LPKGKFQLEIITKLKTKMPYHEDSVKVEKIIQGRNEDKKLLKEIKNAQGKKLKNIIQPKIDKFGPTLGSTNRMLSPPSVTGRQKPTSRFKAFNIFVNHAEEVRNRRSKRENSKNFLDLSPMELIKRKKNILVKKKKKNVVYQTGRYRIQTPLRFRKKKTEYNKVKKFSDRLKLHQIENLVEIFKEKFLGRKAQSYSTNEKILYSGKATIFTITDPINQATVLAVPFEIKMDESMSTSHKIQSKLEGSMEQWISELEMRKKWNKNKRLTPLMQNLFKEIYDSELGEVLLEHSLKARFVPDNSNLMNLAPLQRSMLDELLDDDDVDDENDLAGPALNLVHEEKFEIFKEMRREDFSKRHRKGLIECLITKKIPRFQFLCCSKVKKEVKKMRFLEFTRIKKQGKIEEKHKQQFFKGHSKAKKRKKEIKGKNF